MTTGKTIALTIGTFVGKVVSLLFNTLDGSMNKALHLHDIHEKHKHHKDFKRQLLIGGTFSHNEVGRKVKDIIFSILRSY